MLFSDCASYFQKFDRKLENFSLLHIKFGLKSSGLFDNLRFRLKQIVLTNFRTKHRIKKLPMRLKRQEVTQY